MWSWLNAGADFREGAKGGPEIITNEYKLLDKFKFLLTSPHFTIVFSVKC
jgi:hypothetical protein